MTVLYRVFPYVAAARADEPGGALYVPPQGGGRLDNPSVYSVLYLSDAAAGAIAEAFGRFSEWTAAMLAANPSLPGSVRAVATYRMPASARVCNLDDARRLLAMRLHPSDVVSRDYMHTRAWALRVYQQRRWGGVRWWSYYDPRWGSFGLWDVDGLQLEDVTTLNLGHTALVDAARTIARRVRA